MKRSAPQRALAIVILTGSILMPAARPAAFPESQARSQAPAKAPAANAQAKPQAKTPPLASLTTAQWQEDLDTLVKELPKRHKNLFARLPAPEFRRQAAILRAEMPRLGTDAILVGLLRLAAAPGDAHTGVSFLPSRAVPIMTYWFKEGIFVLNTTPEYRDLLEARITAVEGKPILDVMNLIATIVPHENAAQVKVKGLIYLSSPEILHGLGITPRADSIKLTAARPDGREVAVELKPIEMSQRPAWITAPPNDADAPLYRRNQRLFYWFEYLPAGRTLYLKYNSCREMPGKPFADFARQAFAAFDERGAEKLIVDVRNNGGGDSSIFRPVLDEITKRPALRTKGRVIVIVGRQTFSSAILNALELRKEAGAVIAGEPTGGKPNHFGEVQSFTLPHSGLTVSYSIQYFKEVEGDPDSIEPDILAEPTFADYKAGRDAVLDRLLTDK